MKYQHLSIEERESLQYMWWERKSIRSMAKALNRSPSSIYRELKRNFPPEHKVYTSRLANERALKKRKSRGRHDRLKNERIRRYVVFHLKKRWSPEQIAGKIKLDIGEKISHEAIYRFIYASISYGKPRFGFEDLRPCLRRRRKLRQPKGRRKCQRIPKFQGISIEQRPAIVNHRKRIGDWEGDTVESINHRPGINTLVDRTSGLVLITKLNGKTAFDTSAAVQTRFKNLPPKLKRTLTMDNGSENGDWKNIQMLTGVKCFFAHQYRSWERGTNENTNGLIRDYYPKKTDFDMIPEEEIQFVEYELNTRPRKRLKWKTPLEVFSVALGG
ncbi:MAG: IS30 family transposase [Candidatus Colwellbacteria bacterium]|nr:IS30 family transposase [Candidatus Colwellbacteria bacterium]